MTTHDTDQVRTLRKLRKSQEKLWKDWQALEDKGDFESAIAFQAEFEANEPLEQALLDAVFGLGRERRGMA